MDDKKSPEASDAETNNEDESTRYVTRAEWNLKVREEKLRIVISQTGYDASAAERALQDADWDCKRAIGNYLRGGSAVCGSDAAFKPRTINQQIYSEIRRLMDTASMDYYRKKEYEKLMSRTNHSCANDEA